MLRLLADENFNNDIIRGILRRNPDLDVVRVQDVGLEHEEDPLVLDWAAANDRILLTHDRATMPDFANQRVADGLPMPGVFYLGDRMPISRAIEELLFLDSWSEQAEWAGLVLYLPL